MKKSSLASLIGAIVVVGGGIWYAMHGGDHPTTGSRMNNGPQGPTTVSIVAPQRQDVPVTLQANGTVTPISTVDLHPQTTSTIAKVHIREGQFVKAGELMFTLDDRSERANVDKAQAQVERDRAALADYERQYQRALELLEKNSSPRARWTR
ncbi:efflux RND transporter periplasmic adaptor subunit [Duganella sp. P38]|uniref:efflux RND transporter periplasmic adaptor subunit n=1 Tax=Duganella sp. P38 TaxID=3423949 RepID=UPI003D7A5D92